MTTRTVPGFPDTLMEIHTPPSYALNDANPLIALSETGWSCAPTPGSGGGFFASSSDAHAAMNPESAMTETIREIAARRSSRVSARKHRFASVDGANAPPLRTDGVTPCG